MRKIEVNGESGRLETIRASERRRARMERDRQWMAYSFFFVLLFILMTWFWALTRGHTGVALFLIVPILMCLWGCRKGES